MSLLKEYVENNSSYKASNFNRGKVQTFTPDEFLKLFRDKTLDISLIEIVPPQLGEDGFGYFKVEYSQRKQKTL
jgi:hypothetical protein